MKKVYFDHNATTPLRNEARDVMLEYLGQPLNPSSMHAYGRNAKSVIDNARIQIANAFEISDNYQVIFTASGTEANNIALRGVNCDHVITNPIEHDSIINIIGSGIIPVDKNGVIKLEALETILASSDGKFLVSVQAANGETGVIQPVREICELVHKFGGLFHTDAAQACGKIPFSVSDIGADLISISGHKFGGPVGAGALVFRKNIEVKPIMQGGGQEHRIRPGTQNVPAICGFGLAAKLAVAELDDFSKLSYLLEHLESEICSICPDTIVFGQGVKRIPNTSSFTMPNVSNETQIIHFDLNGFALSAGSACSSGRIDLPRVKMSMGYSEEEGRSAIRISLGLSNTMEEIQQFICLWKDLYYKTNKKAA